MSISEEDRFATEWTLNQFRDDLSTRGIVNVTEGLKPVSFDVYWHVFYANQTKEGGYVSDEQIQRQMKVLNDDFKSANISWNFKNTTRIENEEWFLSAAPGTPQEKEMKTQYHKSDSTALNIFTAQFNSTTKSLGFASLPSSYLSDPISDGLVIRHSTLPGGSQTNYNQGRTTVHEAGHWLGLYHTFEGGCTGVGDNVDDTAPEASESAGCPVGRKSCPDAKLADPIHNFMDYSFDSCMTHFTPGQAVRMHEVIWAFRTKRPPVANSTVPKTSSVAAKHAVPSTSASSATGSLDLEAFPTGISNYDDGMGEDDDGQEYFEEDE
ncbi:zincin [Coprinopsis marcescibilis]|uniref:Zincin n=1 Tax=Coprinopsis marcescibilis TaxID=230819 RepID=A0A5C3LEG8_COPMA|nr:zincin [Coprinopsis marcescibilis]